MDLWEFEEYFQPYSFEIQASIQTLKGMHVSRNFEGDQYLRGIYFILPMFTISEFTEILWNLHIFLLLVKKIV